MKKASRDGDGALPVAEEAVEAENEILLVGGDVAALDGWAEIVHPPEAAALPAAQQPSPLRQSTPPPLPFLLYVVRQQLVLLRRPWPPLQPHLAAARCRRRRGRHRSRGGCPFYACC